MSTKLLLFLLLLAIGTSAAHSVRKAPQETGRDAVSKAEEPKSRPIPAPYSARKGGTRADNTTDVGESQRVKRGAVWEFIQHVVTTKNLIVDQYLDVKNTFNMVYNLINGDFIDPAPPKPTYFPTTTEAPRSTVGGSDTDDNEIKSTTEAYRISRFEFGRILGRNFRGLKRVEELELRDALQQSKYNLQEYKAEARKQFSNSFIADIKKKKAKTH